MQHPWNTQCLYPIAVGIDAKINASFRLFVQEVTVIKNCRAAGHRLFACQISTAAGELRHPSNYVQCDEKSLSRFAYGIHLMIATWWFKA